MLRVIVMCLVLASALVPMYGGVLVWSTGNGSGSTAGVASWIQASGLFTSVTGVDADSMSLAELLAYDQVLYFSNTSAGQDPATIGNTLDSYAASGRRLVLATFAFANQGGNTLAGNIITNGTSPFLVDGGTLYSTASMLSNDSSEFFTGVASLTGFYRDDVILSAGATLRGSWSDGEPLLATRGNVVAVNLFPDDSFGAVSGDNRALFINALVAETENAVPEPATMLLAGTALMGLVLVRLRKQ